MSEKSKIQRILLNAGGLASRMILTIGLSIFTVRYTVKALGVIDYGIYSLVTGITLLFGFLEKSLVSSSQRFFSFTLSENPKNLPKVYVAASNLNWLTILFVFALAETVGLFVLKNYLDIPPDRVDSACCAYHLATFSMIVTMSRVPIVALFIAHEQMTIYAFIGVLETLAKFVAAVVLLNFSHGDNLTAFAFYLLIISLFARLSFWGLKTARFPHISYALELQRIRMGEMLAFSSWNLLGNVSTVLKVHGISVLLNVFFGPTANAAKAIVQQIRGSVEGFSLTVQLASKPQIIKSYASGDLAYMTRLISLSARGIFALLAILIVPLWIDIKWYLQLWLDEFPDFTIILARLALAEVLCMGLAKPLINVVQATGRLKQYMITIGGLQLSILPLAYLALNFQEDIRLAYAVSLIVAIVGVACRLWVIKRFLNIDLTQYTREVIPSSLILLSLSCFACWGMYCVMPITGSATPLRSLVFSLVVLALSWKFALKKQEKKLAKQYIHDFTKKIR